LCVRRVTRPCTFLHVSSLLSLPSFPLTLSQWPQTMTHTSIYKVLFNPVLSLFSTSCRLFLLLKPTFLVLTTTLAVSVHRSLHPSTSFLPAFCLKPS
jgi:hypothetical protein